MAGFSLPKRNGPSAGDAAGAVSQLNGGAARSVHPHVNICAFCRWSILTSLRDFPANLSGLIWPALKAACQPSGPAFRGGRRRRCVTAAPNKIQFNGWRRLANLHQVHAHRRSTVTLTGLHRRALNDTLTIVDTASGNRCLSYGEIPCRLALPEDLNSKSKSPAKFKLPYHRSPREE
jgi:hypothetical protein